MLVVHGRDRTPEQIRAAADGALAELRANHAQTVAVIANRVEPDDIDGVRAALADLPDLVTRGDPGEPAAVRADASAPWSRPATAGSCSAASRWMDREALGIIVAAMSLPNVLARLRPDVAVIAPSDRTDLIPGLMLAHQSGTFPTLAGILLTGGYQIPETIRRLSEGVAAGPADRADRRRHVHHRRAADAGPRPDDQGVDEQDRDGPAALRRAGRPGGAAGRDQRVRRPRCGRR